MTPEDILDYAINARAAHEASIDVSVYQALKDGSVMNESDLVFWTRVAAGKYLDHGSIMDSVFRLCLTGDVKVDGRKMFSWINK